MKERFKRNFGSERDMTTGNATNHILMFSLPILLGNLFQQLYNIVNTFIVGHNLGDLSLAAVGVAFPLHSVIFTLVSGMVSAFSIIVARYFGAKNSEKLKRTVATSIVLSIGFTLFLTIAGLVMTDPLLKMLNTPAEIFETSKRYVTIMFYGLMANMAYNLVMGLLRSIGNSFVPLLTMIFSMVLNIILDFVFIVLLRLEIESAAVATVISHTVSAIGCLIYIRKKAPILHPERESFKLEKELSYDMSSLAISIGLALSIVQVGTLILQGAINDLGPSIITSHTTSRRLIELMLLPLMTMGLATSTYASQNIGASKPERINMGIKSAVLICLSWAALTSAVIYFFGGDVIRLLTDTTDEVVISTSLSYLKLHVPLLAFLGPFFIYRQGLQSIGNRIVPIIISTLELTNKIIATFILAPHIGYTAIMLSESTIWVAGAIILALAYYNSKPIKESRRAIKRKPNVWKES